MIGPVDAAQLYLQRGHGIGIFCILFRWVRPLLWRGAKAVGRETLPTGGKILTDIAANRSPELIPKDILSKHMTESVQKIIGNLRGGVRKRARGVSSVTKKRKKAKRARVIKRDIFSGFTSVTRQHVGCTVTSVSSEFAIFFIGLFKRPCWGPSKRCTSPLPHGEERFGIFDTWRYRYLH